MIKNDRVKLANIGIEPFVSKSLESLRNHNEFTYLSPETVKTQRFQESTDIWYDKFK